ncbi:MAG: hypothetical protein DHS20C16_11510 [Phycisphaerae bacterium]|nr:MAG: hypothetical protein DHS20C16_11510 [Phycisphaerae bacterium]
MCAGLVMSLFGNDGDALLDSHARLAALEAVEFEGVGIGADNLGGLLSASVVARATSRALE